MLQLDINAILININALYINAIFLGFYDQEGEGKEAGLFYIIFSLAIK